MAINLFSNTAGGGIAFYSSEFSSPYNAAPVFTSDAALSVQQGVELNHTLTATDADGDTITYSLVDNAYSWVSIAGAVVTIDPSVSVAAGVYNVTARASDGVNNTDQTLVISVTTAANLLLAPIKRAISWDEGQTPDYVVGDDFIHTATLLAGVNATAFDVSQATSIQAAIISLDHSKKLTDTVTLSSSGLGADWANGVVSVDFDAAITDNTALSSRKITMAKIEIEVELVGNCFTWFSPVRILPAYIE